jgi:type II secretory pathway pseudopilin PulG
MGSKNKKKQKSFTLIEILLYISLASVIFTLVSSLLFSFLEVQTKSRTIAQVEQQGIQVMQQITQNVRNAEAIISPTPGNSSNSLTVDVVDVNRDPTIYSLNGGTIQIEEGTQAAINLVSSDVIITALNFENLSRPGTKGLIRISFTLAKINNEGRYEYDFTRTFTGSAGIR